MSESVTAGFVGPEIPLAPRTVLAFAAVPVSVVTDVAVTVPDVAASIAIKSAAAALVPVIVTATSAAVSILL